MSRERPAISALLFPGLNYTQALARVLADPGTRYAVRQRLAEDVERDPVDSVADAEVLLALLELRLQAVVVAAQQNGSMH